PCPPRLARSPRKSGAIQFWNTTGMRTSPLISCGTERRNSVEHAGRTVVHLGYATPVPVNVRDGAGYTAAPTSSKNVSLIVGPLSPTSTKPLYARFGSAPSKPLRVSAHSSLAASAAENGAHGTPPWPTRRARTGYPPTFWTLKAEPA